MAAHGARRLMDMADNLGRILGVEALAGAQGIAFRAPLATAAPLASAIDRLRADCPPMGADRVVAPEMEAAAGLIRSGALVAAAGAHLFPSLEDAA
jgi:histidine ammonia-lyase